MSGSVLSVAATGELETIYVRNEAYVHRQIAGETILVPVHGRVADAESIYTLNEVGARIWSLLDGYRTLAEVRDVLLAEYDAEPRQIESDLQELVQTLASIEALKPR